MMEKVIVASKNPVKLDAVRAGFKALFPDRAYVFEGINIASGVSDQPMTDFETLSGARNRARGAKVQLPAADYWVGIEGGIADFENGMHAFAWVVIQGAGLKGEARTGTFQLPPEIARLVRSGIELGEADDRVFKRQNSKQNDGAVGILTEGLIDRARYYEHAVVLALIPFKQPQHYSSKS